MPIEKGKAIMIRLATIRQEVSEECFARIDQMLCGSGPYTFSFAGYPTAWESAIQTAYRDAGWTVTRVSDDRDGDYLVFS